jgi:hypothetical protein
MQPDDVAFPPAGGFNLGQQASAPLEKQFELSRVHRRFDCRVKDTDKCD